MTRHSTVDLISLFPEYARTKELTAWVASVDGDLIRAWNECPSFLWMLHMLRGLGVRSTEWSDLFSASAVQRSPAMRSAVSKFSAYWSDPGTRSRETFQSIFTDDERQAGIEASDEVMESLRRRFDIVQLAQRFSEADSGDTPPME